MLLKLPEDTFRAYNRFLKKGNYRKAYQCLENLHHEFPDDEELIEKIVELCIFQWEEFKVARHWLVKLTKMRSLWIDYAQLSRIEAELKNITRSKEYLRKAKELEKNQKWAEVTGGNKRIVAELEDFIKYAESCLHSEGKTESLVDEGDKVTAVKPKVSSRQSHSKQGLPLETVSKSLPLPEEKIKSPVKKEEQEDKTIYSYNIPTEFLPVNEAVFKDFQSASISPLKEVLLLIAYTQLTVQGSFDELLCLNVTNNVEKYWYQIETVKKVLKYFHGRVLLCDEVGLGKTIEAGMLIKEYLMRNMVQSVLILTPPSLVLQWKEELSVKFNIEFSTILDRDKKENVYEANTINL